MAHGQAQAVGIGKGEANAVGVGKGEAKEVCIDELRHHSTLDHGQEMMAA